MNEIVDLDIILAQAPNGYTARGITSQYGSTNALPMKLDGPELFGPIPIITVFTPEIDLPTNPAPSAFVRGLRALVGGFPNNDTVKLVGRTLYEALPSGVSGLYNQVWGAVSSKGDILRIRLHFDAPELGMLPWEYLLLPNDTFLVQDPRLVLIRYPEVSDPVFPLRRQNPLKILIWAANPKKITTLDLPCEVAKIQDALKPLGSRVQVDTVYEGRPLDFLRAVRDGGYHVLHYIGHGEFIEGEGKLLLDPGGTADPIAIGAQNIKPALLDNRTLQLIFLNACLTGTGAPTNAYASLGFNLARYTPAVLAMQYEIDDERAAFFAGEFYRAFADDKDLDRCVTNGRQALIATPDNGHENIDWGIPTLYTRVSSTNLSQNQNTANSVINATVTSIPPRGNPTSQTPIPPDQTLGNLTRTLVDTLTRAFPDRSSISRLVYYYLDKSLEEITPAQTTVSEMFFNIVKWCLDTESDLPNTRLTRLVDGAIQERPARTDLKELRASLAGVGLVSPSRSPPLSAPEAIADRTTPPVPTTPPSETPPMTDSGAPYVPTVAGIAVVEPPLVATFTGGRLTLTAAGRRLFTQTLLATGWAADVEGRDALLQFLPGGLRAGISRSNIAQLHVNSILSTAESWGRMTGENFNGKYSLIVLADTAAYLSQFGAPQGGAGQEAGVFMSIANAMRKRVGLPEATQPEP